MATILVVEDSHDMLSMLAEILEGDGYTVYAARSARQALDTLQNTAPLPDLIISDWTMPGMGGEGLMGMLRRNGDWQYIPVLIMSGGEQQRILAMEAGAAGFIKKPFAVPDILMAIKTIVA